MPLVISAQNNGSYGGNLINQKYSPLLGINFGGALAADYPPLLSNRQNMLRGINVYPPNTLNFYANLPVIVPAVAPMIVASSGRADFMQTLLENAVNHVNNIAPFTGYNDPTTFQDPNNPHGPAVPVAWYSPERSGRPLFVVVHWSEYDYYEAQLGAIANVTVVGYKFTAPQEAWFDLVGFGASRYAAIQFGIAQGYQRAWTVDDNVININAFQNLANIEAHMPIAPPPPAVNMWGISFSGATLNTLIQNINATVNLVGAGDNFGATLPGLLQQATLWNLNLLRAANINMSPLFVTSNEDVSFSNYLTISNRTQRVITAYGVVKVEPWRDGAENVGANVEVPKRRNRLLTYLNNLEHDIQINPAHAQQSISNFIRNTVLPGAGQPLSAALVAQSQAIEQVAAAAIRRGAAWYPANIFNAFYMGQNQNNAPITANLLPAAI